MAKRSVRPKKRVYKAVLPRVLCPVPVEKWRDQAPENLHEVWISREFTVQIYAVKYPVSQLLSSPCDLRPTERLCITHTGLSTAAKANAITRDTLMDIKLQCGRGGQWAVEVYPTLDHGVSLPQARHLFVYYGRPEFA